MMFIYVIQSGDGTILAQGEIEAHSRFEAWGRAKNVAASLGVPEGFVGVKAKA